MSSPRVMIEKEQVAFTPPQYRDVATAAWSLANLTFYTFAILCTLFWVIYLLSFGFTVHLVFPILFWNVLPWLVAGYASKRRREAKQRAALTRERREALADSVTQAAREAMARKAGVSPGMNTATAANSPLARRAHWWTDAPLREENRQRLEQRLGRGGNGDDGGGGDR